MCEKEVLKTAFDDSELLSSIGYYPTLDMDVWVQYDH